MKRACLHQIQKLMDIFLCELERSGIGVQRKSVKRNSRREFHPVGGLMKGIAVDTEVAVNVL
jgi:hypothetical protein